ncbi:MAG: hypothetical protein WAZ18_03985 [Alphaproteobacteria bacterium]
MKLVWPLEARTVPAAAVRQGLVPWTWGDNLTAVGMIVAVLALAPLHGLWAVALAFPVARLAVLDASAYLLPHLYTVPVMVLGLGVGQGAQHGWWIAGVLVAREVAMRLPFKVGLSGGDFMLVAAMLGWLEPYQVCIAAAMGCALWVPVAFMFPKQDVPLGVPLIVGWLVFSLGSALPMARSWPIYGL